MTKILPQVATCDKLLSQAYQIACAEPGPQARDRAKAIKHVSATRTVYYPLVVRHSKTQ